MRISQLQSALRSLDSLKETAGLTVVVNHAINGNSDINHTFYAFGRPNITEQQGELLLSGKFTTDDSYKGVPLSFDVRSITKLTVVNEESGEEATYL